MKYLVTGAAGFIGMHTCIELLKKNCKVIGIDNLNAYYDKKLKLDRLKKLRKDRNFTFYKSDISNFKSLYKIFKKIQPQYVINLAAQAGVRYSIENPFEYSRSNLLGFGNILECCKLTKIRHLIFASSSSVYGGSKIFPFKETQNVDYPISYYAASKRSNEVMAHSYSHLFKIPITGLRFFTVYGPWGRPDMFLSLLANAIKKNKVIDVFNEGRMYRDYTYIDDVTKGIIKISKKIPKSVKNTLNANYTLAPFKIFNIGNNKPMYLKKIISITENAFNKKVKKRYKGMQKGDLKFTHANIKALYNWVKFTPKTSMELGIKKFANWYDNYY